MTRKAHVACNFNCLIESERLLKVTGSHVDCTCGTISETVQDRDDLITELQTTDRKLI